MVGLDKFCLRNFGDLRHLFCQAIQVFHARHVHFWLVLSLYFVIVAPIFIGSLLSRNEG